jgi:hypothetical protein
MSYTLSVRTKYRDPLLYHNTTGKGESGSIHGGMTPDFKKLGNFRLVVPGMGEVNLLDIADRHIANFSKSTWGVLISYQGAECEYRYEGEGHLNVTVNELGQVELTGEGNLIQTDLPSLILK